MPESQRLFYHIVGQSSHSIIDVSTEKQPIEESGRKLITSLDVWLEAKHSKQS